MCLAPVFPIFYGILFTCGAALGSTEGGRRARLGPFGIAAPESVLYEMTSIDERPTKSARDEETICR